ncbi:M48 family metalloprotease [Bradyrhizobium sp. LB11.1]|uniref:M48 family metalloprotease n=1 Tax=Bradyrhizobium sp. LB11.1 TaxID=3156326 RepID=UPI0033964C23
MAQYAAASDTELDTDRLPGLMGSMLGWWLILVLSTWVGVALGAAFIACAAFFSTALTAGLALFVWIPVFAAIIAIAGVIIVFGAVIVPLAATLSAYWKLRYSRAFAVGDWALVGLPADHPLTQILQDQSTRLGLPKCPSTMTIADTANAFAIRASNEVSIVAIGEPFLQHLNREEVEFISGHELGHIVSGDAQRMTFAIGFQEFLTFFLVFNGLKRLARCTLAIVAELVIRAHSRRREYFADAIGAALTSKEAAISALRKIHAADFEHSRKEMLHSEQMFIGVGRLFKTHPTLEKRVRALETEEYLSKLPFRTKRPSIDQGVAHHEADAAFRTGI